MQIHTVPHRKHIASPLQSPYDQWRLPRCYYFYVTFNFYQLSNHMVSGGSPLWLCLRDVQRRSTDQSYGQWRLAIMIMFTCYIQLRSTEQSYEWVQQSFVRNNVSACFIKHVYHNMFRLKSKPSSGVIVYSPQQDALTHNKKRKEQSYGQWRLPHCNYFYVTFNFHQLKNRMVSGDSPSVITFTWRLISINWTIV
jgi:hypothetical protein